MSDSDPTPLDAVNPPESDSELDEADSFEENIPLSKVDHTLPEAPFLSVLPLRNVVVYPNMMLPLFVGREKSIAGLEKAMENDKKLILVTQKEAQEDSPNIDNLYNIGVVAAILQLLKLPDGTVKVLVEGGQRIQVTEFIDSENYLTARFESLPYQYLPESETEVLTRSLLSQFEQYIKLSKKITQEALSTIIGIEEPGRLIDTVAAHMAFKLEQKQKILEISDLRKRLEYLMAQMETEIDLLQVEKRIRGRVKKQMEKGQREYYLNEQIKAIQKELGELDDAGLSEIEQLEQNINDSGMHKEAEKKVKAELQKLKNMSPMSAEASVIRGYLEWMIETPWKSKSRVQHNLVKAQKILDKDHYGLNDVKDRILEFLAVQSRVKKLNGPILCLVGPPGVGKTSLGKSIAKATGRKYARMALGGVRDEAEIRGHRRTYIGSMPGKVIQKLSKVGVKNPLFLLDEVDKMSSDLRGDPASALLEVLDPEQNDSFNDHYLEVDYDLSEIMFICTSNSMNIPGPLLDRMEIIRIPGYTEDEKTRIAQQYLIPKAVERNGLKPSEIEFSVESIVDLIRYYTRESGVRGLEKEISKVCRKVVKEAVTLSSEKSLGKPSSESKKTKLGKHKTEPVLIQPGNLEVYCGIRKYNYDTAATKSRVGQVTGLAWTSVGGELLTIEAAALKGKGTTMNTGSLGDVMQESIKAAMTVVRSRAGSLGIDSEFYANQDIHIHVPEGATPKDGPSAGIGMCTALVSVLTDIPVRSDVAMTGEITLRGQVLAIGGLKEKLLAAHRGGIRLVIIPKENERDLKEIPDNIKADLQIKPVEWIDQVLELSLETLPMPDLSSTLEDLEHESIETDVSTPLVAKKRKPTKDADRLNKH